MLQKYDIQVLKEKFNKSRDYCLESNFDLCLSGQREQKDMEKLFIVHPCLDEMTLNTVYETPQDIKCSPYYLPHHPRPRVQDGGR